MRPHRRQGESAILLSAEDPTTLGAHVRDRKTGLNGFLLGSYHGHEVAEPGLRPQSDCKTCPRGHFRGQKWRLGKGQLTWF